MTYQVTGTCHCGNISVSAELTKPTGDIELRACQCTFCRRHGAAALSDPGGTAKIRIGSSGAIRYHFGLGITDFLVCPECGIYAAAVMMDGEHHLAVLNPFGLGMTEFDKHTPQPMDYDGENTDDRMIRRRQKWMPAMVQFADGN